MQGEFDLGVVPAGVEPTVRLPMVRRLDTMLRRFTGKSKEEIESWTHPWFTHATPFTRVPYLNGGVIVIRGQYIPEFRQQVLDASRAIYDDLAPVQGNVLRMLRNQWNAQVHRFNRLGQVLTVGYFMRARFADQVALSTAMINMNLRVKYLDRIGLRAASTPLERSIRRSVAELVGSRYQQSNQQTTELTGIDHARYGYDMTSDAAPPSASERRRADHTSAFS